MSLINSFGVTVINLCFGPFTSGFKLEANVDNETTTHEIKKVPPTKMLTLFVAFWLPSSAGPTDAIDENTSGAPFPNASKVTPARESDRPNLTVIYSKEGLK